MGAGALPVTAWAWIRCHCCGPGLRRSFENSIDAVVDRDFVAEFLFITAMIGVHLSRLGRDLPVGDLGVRMGLSAR